MDQNRLKHLKHIFCLSIFFIVLGIYNFDDSMERGGARRSPYILGEKSDDNIFAIRAIARDGANGEWSLSKDTTAGMQNKINSHKYSIGQLSVMVLRHHT